MAYKELEETSCATKLRRAALLGIFGLISATSASIYFNAVRFSIFQAQWDSCNADGIGTPHSRIPTRDSSNTEAPLSSIEMAKLFYKHHSKQIHELVNKSTELFWEPTREPRFHIFEEELNEKLNIVEGKKARLDTTVSPYVVIRDLCKASRAFKANRKANPDAPSFPHVLILQLNENWGAVSRYVENRTTTNYEDWLSLNDEKAWRKYGCSQADVDAYLDHPDLKAAVTTQHQFLDHPKVISLPVGFRILRDMGLILKTLGNSTFLDRPQLLMINSNPRPWRRPLLDQVSKKFYGTVKNTYHGYDGAKDRFRAYLNEMRRSKFILSPPGLGLDCYRHWEAIHMGTFPVIEHLNRTDGWHRTLADLPVAWIDSYENLTPEFLEEEYVRLVAKAHSYNYKKLTRQYWIQLVKSSLE